MPPIVQVAIADVTNEIRPILVQVISGNVSVADGMAQMQAAGEKVAG